ncbi:MAG: 16S rRNA pseudouridine(516) synthase [Oscillospiraceae bacterium]|nr:16S rRNA pseudouridine(516) synthase [Oscillospiraceae bacterium]
MPVFRLERLVTSSGSATRSQARGLIKTGRVLINGAPAKVGMRIDTDRDLVTLDGEPLNYVRRVVYMMNKPKGVVTATEDEKEKTVLDLMDDFAKKRGVAPAGRLDKDTEGLLILTDDGELAHNIIAPVKGVVKTYEAEVSVVPAPDAEERIAAGLTLWDGTQFLPARMERLGEYQVRVFLSEGKYHEVKRMLAAVGAPVAKLKRVAIGRLRLDPGLEPGAFRHLSDDEVGLMFEEI